MSTKDLIPLAIAFAIFLAVKTTFSRATSPGTEQIPEEGKRTLSDADITAMVNSFYSLAWLAGGPLWEDEAAMTEVILLCNTNADLSAFANKYGTRAPWWGPSMDLFGTVRTLFSTSQVDTLNERLSSKGITIRF